MNLDSLVSIVILTYNNLEYTRLCLESIYENTEFPFEIILVDNASNDGTGQFLTELINEKNNVKLILNEINLGFARGNNQGASSAQGEYLVFLNNDTVVSKGWLKALIQHLQNPAVGMVGPVTNHAGNESRIPVDYEDLEGMERFAEQYTSQHANGSFEIDMLAFYCVALRRNVFEQVGPLDERFDVGMFEDDDYALRLKQLGYKIICAEDAYIHHWGSASFSKLELSRYWYLFDLNRQKFEEKWNIHWQAHLQRPELIRQQVSQLVDQASWHVSLITEGRQDINRLEARVHQVENMLDEIYKSSTWKVAVTLRNIRLWLVPKNSWRERVLLKFKFLVVFFQKLFAAYRRFRRRVASLQMTWYAYSFDNYKRNRQRISNPDFSQLHCPSDKELVSIVLPVYNGEDYLAEALESILSQTYKNYELILVDDGSTDSTPEIIRDYAPRFAHITVIQQENMKLPLALSNGFRFARGEFLTWTSADNRLKTSFLEKLVDCLRRHPTWDMVYANEDIIGEDGAYLEGSNWFKHYQQPASSPHIFLPANPSELNTYPNNYVGAAYMYRDRVSSLLGDYSRHRFGAEDYDYWMRVNSLLALHHADFKETIYEYRFHSQSLTSQDDELGITRNRTRLMVFDDFRRDFYCSPQIWKIDASTSPQSRALEVQIRDWIKSANQLLFDDLVVDPEALPAYWCPIIYLKLADNPDEAPPGEEGWLKNAYKVLLVHTGSDLPVLIPSAWDACITTATLSEPPRTSPPYQGWYSVPDKDTLSSVIDIQSREHHLRKIESLIENPSPPRRKASVIICTYRRGALLAQSMRSVVQQSFAAEDYELIVVNNDPGDKDVRIMVEELVSSIQNNRSVQVRVVDCPARGLSSARNAGIALAEGEIVCFLDDDACAKPDWLEQTWSAFQSSNNINSSDHIQRDPGVGVVGGDILLQVSQPRPRWLKSGWEKFWSHFDPDYQNVTNVENWWEFPWGANWSAKRQALLEIGGFRTRYGRRSADFGGGEELIAALLIQRLGYKITISPFSQVDHYPETHRFTFKHIQKTIQAGKLNEYNLQRDLYLPMNLRLGVFVRQSLNHLSCAALKRHIGMHQRLEYLLYLWMELRSGIRYLSDRIQRFRKPVVLR